MQEKLSLIQGFLQADVRDQLSELEAKLRCEELSEVRPGACFPCGGRARLHFAPAPVQTTLILSPLLLQERYLAKVKALLHQELSAENGDAAPLLRASNGCSKNGAYGSDEDSERAGPDGEEDSAMEMEEAAASSSSSTPVPRARKARRSRSNGESKSNGSALAAGNRPPRFSTERERGGSPRGGNQSPSGWGFGVSLPCSGLGGSGRGLWKVQGGASHAANADVALVPTGSPASSRVTRSSGRQPSILSMFSKGSVRGVGPPPPLGGPRGAFTLLPRSPNPPGSREEPEPVGAPRSARYARRGTPPGADPLRLKPSGPTNGNRRR